MFRIEIQDDGGNKTVIESKNAIVVYGEKGTNAISTFSADNDAESAEIIDLITDAKNVFVDMVSGDERTKRLAIVGLMDMISAMKFREKLIDEKSKIKTERASKGDMLLNFNEFGRRF